MQSEERVLTLQSQLESAESQLRQMLEKAEAAELEKRREKEREQASRVCNCRCYYHHIFTHCK